MSALTLAISEIVEIVDFQHTNVLDHVNTLEHLQTSLEAIAALQDPVLDDLCYAVPDYLLPLSCTFTPPNTSGEITYGTPTVTSTTISQPFTYSGTNATNYILSINGSPSGYVSSPVYLTGLTPSTTYEILVTPVVSTGTYITNATNVTTLSSSSGGGGSGGGVAESGTIVFGTATTTQTTIEQPFTYNGTDSITGYVIKLDGTTVETIYTTAKTYTYTFTGLTPETEYAIGVSPLRSSGVGTQVDTTATTLPEPPSGTLEFTGENYTPNGDGTATVTLDFTYSGTDTRVYRTYAMLYAEYEAAAPFATREDFIAFLETKYIGTITESPLVYSPIEAGKLYRFYVMAVNDGGYGNTT